MKLEEFLEKYPTELVSIADYLNEIKRTYTPKFWDDTICVPKLQSILDNVHCVMGIVDEFNEYSDVISAGCDPHKMCDEMGDILWYIGNYCNFNGISFEKLPIHNIPYNGEFVKLLGIHKKELAYFKFTDINIREDLLRRGLTYLIQILESEFIPIEYVLYKNLKKLYIRYPEKFESELAINKNVDIEMEKIYK